MAWAAASDGCVHTDIMNRRRLLRHIQQGHLQNVRYADFVELVKGFGFVYDIRHTTGSHQIYKHPLVQRPFPLQPLRGEAKVQQIRELLKLVEDYNLELED